MRKYIFVNVFRSNGGDCSNDGVSAHFEKITLFEEKTSQAEVINAGIKTEKAKLLCFKVQDFNGYKRAVPVFENGKYAMFGGTFGFSSDSRYAEISGIEYPIPICDRIEL